jgi:hypothetical protein
LIVADRTSGCVPRAVGFVFAVETSKGEPLRPGLYRILSVAFGDVEDGDGDLDLAVGSGGGQNVVYLNTLVRCVYLPIIMKSW